METGWTGLGLTVESAGGKLALKSQSDRFFVTQYTFFLGCWYLSAAHLPTYKSWINFPFVASLFNQNLPLCNSLYHFLDSLTSLPISLVNLPPTSQTFIELSHLLVTTNTTNAISHLLYPSFIMILPSLYSYFYINGILGTMGDKHISAILTIGWF